VTGVVLDEPILTPAGARAALDAVERALLRIDEERTSLDAKRADAMTQMATLIDREQHAALPAARGNKAAHTLLTNIERRRGALEERCRQLALAMTELAADRAEFASQRIACTRAVRLAEHAAAGAELMTLASQLDRDISALSEGVAAYVRRFHACQQQAQQLDLPQGREPRAALRGVFAAHFHDVLTDLSLVSPTDRPAYTFQVLATPFVISEEEEDV